MSRTLFWYIFKDLFRIFMMTSGALAGIMSFGGLLRPLTQQGLDAGQVTKMLGYLSPAMSAYSFPIAALFAATVVYGRLSADNEIVAARAGGISHLAMAFPALVLGLVVAIVSMLFLCFVVPHFTLKVEKVIYSNIAQMVANKFERNHQMKMDGVVVYAQEARAVPTPPGSREQQLVLVAPMIVNYERTPGDPKLQVPTDFYTARQATVFIRQTDADDRVQFSFNLDDGMRLPRGGAAGGAGGGPSRAGIGTAQFGPVVRESMIGENTKFMVLDDLKRLYERPWRSRKVKGLLDEFVGEDQQAAVARQAEASLRDGASVTFAGPSEAYEVTAGPGTTVTNRGVDLVLTAPPGGPRTIAVRQSAGSPEPLSATCRELRVRSYPLADGRSMSVGLRMLDASLTVGDDTSDRPSFERSVVVPMSADVRAIERKRQDPDQYRVPGPQGTKSQLVLSRELIILRHDIISELHSRASFAVSCFVLVVVGCTLGMMTRSGNFLTAFAVSFVPALLCITLIMAGQRVCGSVPHAYWKVGNSLQLGVAMIWSGNAIVGALGAGLLWRLQRT